MNYLCFLIRPLLEARAEIQKKKRFSQKTNERICFSILATVQDRKTNSFVSFLGEPAALQFCFEIYWPLIHVELFSTGLHAQTAQKAEFHQKPAWVFRLGVQPCTFLLTALRFQTSTHISFPHWNFCKKTSDPYRIIRIISNMTEFETNARL